MLNASRKGVQVATVLIPLTPAPFAQVEAGFFFDQQSTSDTAQVLADDFLSFSHRSRCARLPAAPERYAGAGASSDARAG